jgi:GAF domain-containing protein
VETPDHRTAGLLAEALAESTSVEDCVEHIVEFAVQSLRTGFGGITMIHGGGRRFETIGATHHQVEEADHLQYELREGPCVDASLQAKSLSSTQLATDPRWPRWGPQAAALGFRSIISAELHARGQRIGAINLYGADTRTFSEEDFETVKMFAHQGSLALGFVKMEETLGQAIEGRTLIGQAQGILMERFGIGSDQAFAVLRRYSQGHNLKLQEIAARVVEGRALPGTEETTARPDPPP